MANLAFDTHKYVKRLTAVGMPEKQAEVIAYEQRSLIEDQLATKHDIAEVKRDIAEVKRDIEELRAEVKRDIAEVKRDIKESEQRLIIRLGGMMIAGFGVIAALIKFLPTSAL